MVENAWHVVGERGNWYVGGGAAVLGWTFKYRVDADRLCKYLNATHRSNVLMSRWNDALSDDNDKMMRELYELREENRHLI